MRTSTRVIVKSKQITTKIADFYEELSKVTQEYGENGLKIDIKPAVCNDPNLMSMVVIGYKKVFFDTETGFPPGGDSIV